MAIKQHTIYAKRGDTLRRTINVTQDGVPVDITGWTIYFTVKENKTDDDANAVISKDITSHTNPTGGVSTLLVLPSETDTLLGTYYYDLQIKRPITQPQSYDDIETPLEGTIEFSIDETRRTT